MAEDSFALEHKLQVTMSRRFTRLGGLSFKRETFFGRKIGTPATHEIRTVRAEG